MTIFVKDLSAAEIDEEQTPFLRYTDYLPLDTVVLADDVEWNANLYESIRGRRYIINRDIPAKLVRHLIARGIAEPGIKLWENQQAFHYDVADQKIDVARIYVDERSLTDFYSIPKFFHRVYSPTDIGHKAAHIHDILCDSNPVRFLGRDGREYRCTHPVNWRQAADIFCEAQQVALVPALAARVKYWAVKLGGPRFGADTWNPIS